MHCPAYSIFDKLMRQVLLFWSLIMPLYVVGQLEDNVWAFGYKYSDLPEANGIYFNFNDSLSISYHSKPMSLLDSYASICDTSGQLLLLSNGCYIETGENIYVENSAGLNPGLAYNSQCLDDSLGYSYPNSMLFLQAPGSPSLFYLFHIRTYFTIQPLVALQDKWLYTTIDMAANNGQGKVLQKNQLLVADTLDSDGLAAVRHANGRDWWIVIPKQISNKYYIALLSPSGLSVKEQYIGEPTWSQAGGEMVFSPDGSKLARFNTRDDLRLFDFDRCTGALYNPQHIEIQDDADNGLFGGLAFSADGSYLYAGDLKRLLQFDMRSADIPASKTIIAEVDPPACPLSGSIGFMELGPDGRIYSRPLNGQRCMHRMNHPERPGTACEMQQNYYHLDFAYKNLPHFPNFRLGPVDGSACDTFGLDNHPLADWRYDDLGALKVDFTSVSWYEPQAWLWDFGDNSAMSSDTNPTHTFPTAGAYPVCLTVSNTYGSDTKCKTVWAGVTGIKEAESKEEQINIYPNPSSGTLHWRGLPIGQMVQVRLFNTLGRLCGKWETDAGQVDASGMIPGLYWLEIWPVKGSIWRGSVMLY